MIWQLSNGTLIGKRAYDYDSVNDYRCAEALCFITSTTWSGDAAIHFSFSL